MVRHPAVIVARRVTIASSAGGEDPPGSGAHPGHMTDERLRDPVRDREVLDVLVGVGAAASGLALGLARPLQVAAGMVGAGCLRVLRRQQTAVRLGERGRQVRTELEQAVTEGLHRVFRELVAAALAVIDLTELVRRHVDLDALARGLDVDAVVSRADLDAAASRIDVGAVVARVDPGPVAARIDLDALVARVDLDAVVARLDLDAVVSRVDLEAIVKRVDIDAVIARVDVDAVLARLDLAGIANQVIDAIDLPEILRESTGSVASEAVRGVRADGVQADEAVARFVDRLLRRSR